MTDREGRTIFFGSIAADRLPMLQWIGTHLPAVSTQCIFFRRHEGEGGNIRSALRDREGREGGFSRI